MSCSEMPLNYQMTMKRYPNPNGGVGGSIPGYEMFSLLDGKSKSPSTARYVVTPPCTKGILQQGRANMLKFTLDCPTLYIITTFIIRMILDPLFCTILIREPFNHHITTSKSPWFLFFYFLFQFLIQIFKKMEMAMNRDNHPLLFSLFSMTPLGNAKNVVLSRCRLLVNMTNGLKLLYYGGNTKKKKEIRASKHIQRV
jgi:hypothetical protein